MAKVIRLTEEHTGKVTLVPDTKKNREFYSRLSNNRKKGQKFRIEHDLDEFNLPKPIQTVAEKAREAEIRVRELEIENERLRRAANIKPDPSLSITDSSKSLSAAEAVTAIKIMTNAEDIAAFIKDDDRLTVVAEAERQTKKLAEA
jgi:hypothetical protein